MTTTAFEIRGWEAEIRGFINPNLGYDQSDLYLRRVGSDLPAVAACRDVWFLLESAETLVNRYLDALERFTVSIELRLQRLDPNSPDKQGLLDVAQSLLEGSILSHNSSYAILVGRTIEVLSWSQGDGWSERTYKNGDMAIEDIFTIASPSQNHSLSTTYWRRGVIEEIGPQGVYFTALGIVPLEKFLTRNQKPVDWYPKESERLCDFRERYGTLFDKTSFSNRSNQVHHGRVVPSGLSEYLEDTQVRSDGNP